MTAITFWSFQKEKWPPNLGGLSSRKRCILRHRGAVHNPNNAIAIGTLIHVKHAVIAVGRV